MRSLTLWAVRLQQPPARRVLDSAHAQGNPSRGHDIRSDLVCSLRSPFRLSPASDELRHQLRKHRTTRTRCGSRFRQRGLRRRELLPRPVRISPTRAARGRPGVNQPHCRRPQPLPTRGRGHRHHESEGAVSRFRPRVAGADGLRRPETTDPHSFVLRSMSQTPAHRCNHPYRSNRS
jgi:hypothetical protein